MTDITKCTDTKCPSRRRCLRYTIKPSYRQAYGDFNREEGRAWCDGFLPTDIKQKDKQ